ncbi:hypothetical protein HDV06_003339 [Boothiomyces sp. JEL0866]|nr:hypothetical protein HDV06_003339 [Boothiomyces sp. JEL0866]
MYKLPFTFHYEGLVLIVDILKQVQKNPNKEWLDRLSDSMVDIVELFTCKDINIRRRSFQTVKLVLEIKPLGVDLVIEKLFQYRVGLKDWWESLDDNTTEFCGLGQSVNDKHSFQLATTITLDLLYLLATDSISCTQQLLELQLLYPTTDLFNFILQLFGDHDYLLISTLQKLLELSQHKHILKYDIHPVKLFLSLMDHFDFDSTIILDLLLDLQSIFANYLISILSFDTNEIKQICREANALNSDTDYYGSLVSTLQELNLTSVDSESRLKLKSLLNKLDYS